GNISVAGAVIGDISAPDNRAKNFGLIGIAFGLGFIFGPAISGVLSDHHLVSWFSAAMPFYFITALSIINVFLIIKFLPETLKLKSEKRLDISRPLHNIIIAFRKPGLRNIMPSTFLFNSGFTFFTTFFAVIMTSKYHFTQSGIGNYFAFIGLMSILAQAFVVRRVAKIAKDYQILRFSMFGSAFCLFAFFMIPDGKIYLLYCIPPFLSSCNALTMAFNSTLVTRVTPDNLRGEAMGINSSVMAMAQAIPAIASGYIASISTTLPIIVGSLICMCAGIVFWLLFDPRQFDYK
ncbi:MAG: tetracycline resistance efflux pump, partial [Burkholderiales bacterium]|nr:tetracycline resistance efflux pump [Burkholderiales bacterium]